MIIDFSRYPVGSQVVLKNLFGAGRTADIMRFDGSETAPEDSVVPSQLRPVQRINQKASKGVRDFCLNRSFFDDVPLWTIDDDPYETNNSPRAEPKEGDIEHWSFRNYTDHAHPMHIHLVQFQVVALDKKPVDPAKYGWKDTFVVPAGEPREVTVIARFNRPGRFVFHCHNLEHEDYSMMAEFEVRPD